MGFLAPYDNPGAVWFTPPDPSNTAKVDSLVAGPVVQLDQIGWDALGRDFEKTRNRRSPWEDVKTGLILGGSLLTAGFALEALPATLLAAAPVVAATTINTGSYIASAQATDARKAPASLDQFFKTPSLTSSFSTPLGPVMGIPTESATGEFFPFGYQDSAFLASAAAAADANTPGASIHPDAIVLPLALLLLGLAWWYVRKK